MLGKSLAIILLLISIQGVQVTKPLSMRQSSLFTPNLLQMRLADDCVTTVPIDINCGNWDCSATAGIPDYTATVDKIESDVLYATLYDETSSDDDCSEVAVVTVTCSSDIQCPILEYDNVDVELTMPDGTIAIFIDVEVQFGVV